MSLESRQRESEWMDEPDADLDDLAKSLRFLRIINRLFGYNRATLSHLKRFSRTWPKGKPIRILDVATGSADVPLQVLKLADRLGWNVQIVAIDLHARTIDFARQWTRDPRLTLLQADATQLPFESGSFDYAMTSLFLHHLDEPVIVRVLREMDRVTRRGIIVADLLRHRRALIWINLFTLFANPMLRHDAAVSVRQSFLKDEILALRDQAGVGYADYHRHFGHRFVLAGEK